MAREPPSSLHMPDIGSVFTAMTNALADGSVDSDGCVVVKGKVILVLVVAMSKLAHREEVAERRRRRQGRFQCPETRSLDHSRSFRRSEDANSAMAAAAHQHHSLGFDSSVSTLGSPLLAGCQTGPLWRNLTGHSAIRWSLIRIAKVEHQ